MVPGREWKEPGLSYPDKHPNRANRGKVLGGDPLRGDVAKAKTPLPGAPRTS